ncbi:MAG TPA: ArsA family ATPase, partial [Pyrinomonadaceae bacterium]|nr:ArsA family ATPase [Pyrinomonadaceae bacterium]
TSPESSPGKQPPASASKKKTVAPEKSSASSSTSAPLPPAAALPAARYLFFGGKGGTGKTTAAASAALLLLDAAADGEDVLLFSTDPAHSLSDSLAARIGDRTVEVARRGGARLFAREMDAARALEEFKARHRGVLKEIADRGTLLDDADINQLLDLSLPGMDELMSLFELSEIERTGSFARVVVDTAPSGHTSRLLRLPEVFARWVGALDLMSEKHRYIVAQFARGRRGRADEVDVFLRELAERVERVRAVVYDERRTAFTLVTIAEAMGVEETARYLALLRAERVPVTDLIVNRVEREHGACPFCRARVRAQSRWLARIEEEFKELRLHRVPLLEGEVRGREALRRFARLAWGDADGAAVDESPPLENESLKGRDDDDFSNARDDARSFTLEPRRLLIFGGKGGTGKTTAAASAALALAGRAGGERVLVFSTDPAHSLSDSFDEQVGELKQSVAGVSNLDAMEIDPARRFEELKERYRSRTDALFESLTGGSRWEVQFDREAMRELVALAPPGIDEIAALSGISDLLEEGRYASIVLDTAPTGHLVRFLELPEVALSWVHTFIKLLLKYKNVVRWGGIAEELVALSKSIKRVAALLTDASQCEFVGVAIPERMSLEETVRLAATLERLGVPMRRLLVNNVVTEEAAGACAFCAARRRGQLGVLAEFRERLAGVEVFLAPQRPHEVRGRARLEEHFAGWRGAGSSPR